MKMFKEVTLLKVMLQKWYKIIQRDTLLTNYEKRIKITNKGYKQQ